MTAWQFTAVNEPLVLNDVPEPVPGPGEVVIDVQAAGLCHSDVSVLRDPFPQAMMPHLPMTIGHEIAGVVRVLGDGATDSHAGAMVRRWMSGG